MAELVKVLVSPDRRWRVEIRSDGRAEVRWHNHLRMRVEEHQLREKLAEVGVDLGQLIED